MVRSPRLEQTDWYLGLRPRPLLAQRPPPDWRGASGRGIILDRVGRRDLLLHLEAERGQSVLRVRQGPARARPSAPSSVALPSAPPIAPRAPLEIAASAFLDFEV